MSKITPCLWFDGNAEEAASLYVSLLPDSRVDSVSHAPADNPSTPAGAVLAVDFTLAGLQFRGINGGPQFAFTEAISFAIDCGDQGEVDRLWDALVKDGGSPGQCGWHTPLSAAEEIPWGGTRLIVGTGAKGQLPISPEVRAEAERRGIAIEALPTREACRLLAGVDRADVYAILHVTC